MAVEVEFSVFFREFLNNKKAVFCNKGKVYEILDEIFARYPELKNKILNEEGNTRSQILLVAQNKNSNESNNKNRIVDINTYIEEGSRLKIFIALAGG